MHPVARLIDQNDAARFLKFVEVKSPDECWPWRGGVRIYGKFEVRRKTLGAHQVAAVIAYGFPKKEDAWVLHHCDNPICVNPKHLFYGDHQKNMEDCASKGRNGTHRHPEIVRGERNPRTKLTIAQVEEIRKSQLTCTQLGRIYGVTWPTINRIKKGHGWKTNSVAAEIVAAVKERIRC